jgi:serine/threonine protein kinase/tetratricopeptide (TPR) repeat protein
MQEIFLAAVERHRLEDCDVFLDQACGTDDELRRQVNLLLKAHREAGSVPGAALPERDQAGIYQPVTEGPGTIVGPYKLLDQIGEGGMGTVYMAEQTEPVKRKVALKIIKPGMDSRQVLARFDAERQALALMDHPNIAKVLDAGRTPSVSPPSQGGEKWMSPRLEGGELKGGGRPYFVMELVKGVPITRYCDEHRLTPRQRLELFVPVCQAIQHAHQKGIIHRDIKPSNVLVALYDDKPVPKVIDFGVAKATGPQLTEQSLHTGFGAVVGTVEYMSPEQASFNQLDIDTRSDIYSLGVLLYELLAGSPPFTRQELEKAGVLEMLRVIREQEPSKPSTKLSTAEGLPTLAANRGTEPAKLTKLVRGELDWIVMKALEKDRSRRYETASGLARDIERYLHDEPVAAGPPSTAYRFRKFVRRNKTALTLAGLILFFIGSLGGGLGWVVRDRAAQRAATRQEVELALIEVGRLHGQGKYAEAMLVAEGAAARLAGAGGDEDLERQVQGFLARLRQEEADRRMVARVEAIRLRSDKKEVFSQVAGSRRPEFEATFKEYGLPIFDLDVDEAARRIAASPIGDSLVAALNDAVDHLGDPIGDRLLSIAQRAVKDPWRKQYFAARRGFDWKARQQLTQQPEALEQPPATLYLLAQESLRGSDDPEFLRRAQRRYPADFWLNYLLGEHLRHITSWSPAGHGLRPAEESIGFLRVALALRPESPALRWSLAYSLKEAAWHLINKMDRDISVWGSTLSASTVGLIASPRGQGPLLAISALFPGRPKDEDAVEIALSYLSEAIELAPADEVPWRVRGGAYAKRGQLGKAIADYSKAIELKPNDHGNLAAWNNRGIAYYRLGQLDKAVVDYSKAIDLKADCVGAWINRGEAYHQLGQLDKAVADFSKAIRLDPNLAAPHIELGNVLLAKAEYDAAGTAYKEGIRLDPRHSLAHNALGQVLVAKNEYDAAIAEFKEAIRLDPRHARAHIKLGNVLLAKGDFPAALKALQRGHDLGQEDPAWSFPSAQAIKECERLLELDAKLPKVLKGEVELADAAERLALGQLCQHKKRNHAAARFYTEAFGADPKLADTLRAPHRYNAACAAALAGCGQGEDVAQLDDEARARLRRQALDWLRTDLQNWRDHLEKEPDKAHLLVQRTLRHWQQDADFASARGAGPLARLPEAERQAWQQLWDEVETLVRRTADQKK